MSEVPVYPFYPQVLRAMRADYLFLILVSVGVFLSTSARGQGFFEGRFAASGGTEAGEEDEIETDRDSFTPATSTAGKGRVIVESAYSFIDNRSVPETHSFPELLVRHGISDWLELRLLWNYEVGGAGNPITGNVPNDLGEESVLERESRIMYGCKASLTEQADWLPESAVLLQGFTPTSGEATDTQMSATYVFGWTSLGGVIWDSAIRFGTSKLEDDHFNADFRSGLRTNIFGS